MTEPKTRALQAGKQRGLLDACRSVERAGGQYETGRNPRLGRTAGVKTRSVEPVSGRSLHCDLGFATVGENPRHDRLELRAFGQDRGALDDGAAGVMSSRQAGDQSPNRVVVHVRHRSRSQ